MQHNCVMQFIVNCSSSHFSLHLTESQGKSAYCNQFFCLVCLSAIKTHYVVCEASAPLYPLQDFKAVYKYCIIIIIIIIIISLLV